MAQQLCVMGWDREHCSILPISVGGSKKQDVCAWYFYVICLNNIAWSLGWCHIMTLSSVGPSLSYLCRGETFLTLRVQGEVGWNPTPVLFETTQNCRRTKKDGWCVFCVFFLLVVVNVFFHLRDMFFNKISALKNFQSGSGFWIQSNHSDFPHKFSFAFWKFWKFHSQKSPYTGHWMGPHFGWIKQAANVW